MDILIQNLRYAARTLRKTPGFTAVAVLTLALGIGANTVIFSFVNGYLLRPLPFAQADRLVSIHSTRRAQGIEMGGLSFADMTSYKSAHVFDDVAGFYGDSFTLTGGDHAINVQGSAVTPNLFPLLGVQPNLGRSFRPDEAAPAGLASVVILSDGLWHSRFGGDDGVIGRPIHVNGRMLTVVGVMPPGFGFPEVEELWVPLGPGPGERRADRYLRGIGRLAPNASVERAQASTAAIADRLATRYPATNRGWGARVVSLRDAFVDGGTRLALALLMGAVGFVLLIACVNVANLLLARGAARQRELAVRAALGAGRWRLVRQLLTESILLGVAGGAIGVIFASWGIDVLAATIAVQHPFWLHINLDPRVLLYTLGLAVLTGILFGTLPALRASRNDVHASLKYGRRGGTARGSRIRRGLVTAEIALSLVLLVSATLMIKSFLRLQNTDPGFDARGLLTMRLDLLGDPYDPITARAGFVREATERLAAFPGVRAAATTSDIPIDDVGPAAPVVAAGQPGSEGEAFIATAYASTSGFFDALGAPLVAGRTFTAREIADSAASVAIINEALAERLWPSMNALGRRLRVWRDEDAVWLTVVGIAPNLHYEEFGEATPQSRLQVHLPYGIFPEREIALLIRTVADPGEITAAARRVLHEIDPAVATYDVRTMDQVRRYTTWGQRVVGELFGAFAAIALLLAAIGVYGVVAYGVSQRTREIGIRMALGARRSEVLWSFVRQSLVIAAFGVLLGLAGAFALTRLLSSLLYGVEPTDPATFLTTSVVLAGIALLASYLAGRRATTVDPMTALRHE